MKTSNSPTTPKNSAATLRSLVKKARKETAREAVRSAYRDQVHLEILNVALSYLSEVEVNDFARRVEKMKRGLSPAKPEAAKSKTFAATMAEELLAGLAA
jgi:hypothetical protein